MDWDEFETQLSRSTRGGKTRAVSDQTLRDHFGSEKLERLQRLAERARSVRSKREPVRGNIIFIPGIMGSELTVTEDGDDDTVWISFPRLIWGGINKLRLTKDGMREADSARRVQPSGLDKDSYAETILWLKAYWNVEPFAYDWRKDLDQAAERLKELVETKFKNQPVHLVAHSMGGLRVQEFHSALPQRVEIHVGAEEGAGRATHYARHTELWLPCHCASHGRQRQAGEVVGCGGLATRLG